MVEAAKSLKQLGPGSPRERIELLSELNRSASDLTSTLHRHFDPPRCVDGAGAAGGSGDATEAAATLDEVSRAVLDSLADLAAALQAWRVNAVVELTTTAVKLMPKLLHQAARFGNHHKYLNTQRQVGYQQQQQQQKERKK